jgi:Flp pilus assembly protein CpaB
MRSRGLVVAIAVVLAVLAAVGVIVYTNGVKNQATKVGTTQVLVSKQDIPTGTLLDTLVNQGAFQDVRVPNDALVKDAVTSEDQLQGQTTTAPIYANEQIPLSRLTSGTNPNTSNLLGISEGNVGIGIQVAGPAAVNGSVNVGDNVSIYATFPKGTPVTKLELKQLFSAAQIQKLFQAAGQTSTTSGLASAPVILMPFDFTTTLIPSVKVLSAVNPPVDTNTGRANSGTSTFVLDMTPTDAADIVFANVSAVNIWMGLLPPKNPNGYPQGATIGVPVGRVIGVGGK